MKSSDSPMCAERSTSTIELELINVSKTFQSRRKMVNALDNISISFKAEEFVAIVGRSGCGKTTFLRILAGLTSPTTGEVRVQGRPLWNKSARDPSLTGEFGVVFQAPNLFPWYNVEDNITLPLKLRGIGKKERLSRAHELCELVGLAGFENSRPSELSGGMQQRVAIARALSYRPKILLMDEPFGSLDALTREQMNTELQTLVLASKATVVLVTHSITEAVLLADRVILLSPRPGRIQQDSKVDFPRPRTNKIEEHSHYQSIVQDLRSQLNLQL